MAVGHNRALALGEIYVRLGEPGRACSANRSDSEDGSENRMLRGSPLRPAPRERGENKIIWLFWTTLWDSTLNSILGLIGVFFLTFVDGVVVTRDQGWPSCSRSLRRANEHKHTLGEGEHS